MDAPAAFAALYRDTVLDHGRAPRHTGALPPPARGAQAHNPLCGDRIALTLRLDGGGRVAAIRHDTAGCLLCMASASLLATHVLDLDRDAVAVLHEALRRAVLGDPADPALGELAALTGVAAYPARQRCVLLPWEALHEALRDEDGGAP